VRFSTIAANGLQLAEGGVFGAVNCQATLKFINSSFAPE